MTKQIITVPKVVFVGRANVGKSSLFNRIIEEHKALTSDIAGTTRDINKSFAYWNSLTFEIYDTGGIDALISKRDVQKMAPKENEEYAVDILKRSQAALKKADVIVFVVDGKVGVLPEDMELARSLKKFTAPVILAVNKIDTMNDEPLIHEFAKLGFNDIYGVSAKTSLGVGDFLDKVTDTLTQTTDISKTPYASQETDLKIAMLGRPNVGKSSLFNKLIGEEQVIVSEKEHTTREPHDMTLLYQDKLVTFIDTAGIRRKSKVEEGLEHASVMKTIHSIKRADIVLFVIDVSQPITTQDKHLAELLLDSNAGIIMVANKWDLIEGKHTNVQAEVTKNIHRGFPFLTWAPIVFTSALTGQHVHKLYEKIFKVQADRSIEVPQDFLNEFLIRATKKHKPIAQIGIKRPSILDFEQIRTEPPVFQLRIKGKDTIAGAYLRFLENNLRSELGLEGTKLWITVKK